MVPQDRHRAQPGVSVRPADLMVESRRLAVLPVKKTMDTFFERLIVHAATIDELLSGDFEPLSGQKGDIDIATRRLGAWCRSCASGDWSLFARRLQRDGLSITEVLAKLATVRRSAASETPAWIDDAVWIE